MMRGECERWQVVQPAVPAHQPTSVLARSGVPGYVCLYGDDDLSTGVAVFEVADGFGGLA
jgi:hypothetical protein